MEFKQIKTDADYREALKRLEIIFDAQLGTQEGNELEILGVSIHEYENIQDGSLFLKQ